MQVILPYERAGMPHLKEAAPAEMINKWRQQLQPNKVTVAIPKFKIESNYFLNRYLESPGLMMLLHLSVNFSSMIKILTLPASMHIFTASQNALANVNGQGVGAAVVNAIVLDTRGIEPQPDRFIVDQPVISITEGEPTGAILFMGRFFAPC